MHFCLPNKIWLNVSKKYKILLYSLLCDLNKLIVIPVIGIFIIFAHFGEAGTHGLQKLFIQQFEHAVYAIGQIHFGYLIGLLQGALLYLHDVLLVHKQDGNFEIGVW